MVDPHTLPNFISNGLCTRSSSLFSLWVPPQAAWSPSWELTTLVGWCYFYLFLSLCSPPSHTWLPFTDPKAENLPLRLSEKMLLPPRTHVTSAFIHSLPRLHAASSFTWTEASNIDKPVLCSHLRSQRLKSNKLAWFTFCTPFQWLFSRSGITFTPTISSKNPKARRHALSTVLAEYIFLRQAVF